MADINIDLEEVIIKYNISDLNDQSQKLYLISLFLDDIKKANNPNEYENKPITIFKEIKFIIKRISNIEDIINFSGNNYCFNQNKRIITFIDNNSERIFVYNKSYFENILKEKKYKLFEVSGLNKTTDTNDDSLISEISGKEISDIYNNYNVTEIKKIETNSKMLLEKFNSKSDFPENISDLSLNIKNYNTKFLENKIEFVDDLVKFKNDELLYNFIDDEFSKVLYFFGQKGCGKSIHLLFSTLYIHNQQELKYPRLYIDYKSMKENTILRKLIFKKEMFYMAQNVDELKELFDLKCHKNITKINNFLMFFKEFLRNILKSNKFQKNLIVVIDNYDEIEEFKENDNYLEEIIEFCKNKANMIKLIIAGNGAFIQKKQKLFLNYKLFKEIDINQEICLECQSYEIKNNKNIESLKNKIPYYIYSHPEYYFRFRAQLSIINNINSFTDLITSEEEETCHNINFFGKYYSLKFENIELSYEIFNKFYDILPNFYLIFTRAEKGISFKIANEIFKIALKKSVEYEVEVNSIENLLKLNNKESTQIGIYEEKLLTLFLKYNKLFLNNLFFVKDNQLEVEEIYEFINSKYDRYNKAIHKDKPIIITQTNYKGKNYDLLILIPIENTNNYDGVFIQIGLNKKKDEIIKLVKDISGNSFNYIKGIRKYLDINILNIYLNFIFDKETQENYIETGLNLNLCGSNYCLLNEIKFFLFSLEDYKLYKLNEDKKFEMVISYEYKIKDNHILGEKRIRSSTWKFDILESILSEEESKKLKEIEPKLKYWKKIMIAEVNGNKPKKKLIKNHIYLLINNLGKKIFYIKGKKKIFKNGNFIDLTEDIHMDKEVKIYDIKV